MKRKKSAMTKKETDKLKTLTIEEIEAKETELALSTDASNFFLNSKKIEMLDKIAQLKLKRLQLELQQQAKETEEEENNEPIKVEFVSPNTMEQTDRLARLEKEVDDALGSGTNHA